MILYFYTFTPPDTIAPCVLTKLAFFFPTPMPSSGRPRPFFCPKHALRKSQHKGLKWDALAAVTPLWPAHQTPCKSGAKAAVSTQLSSYQTAVTEYSEQRYRSWRRLTDFRPSAARDHAHFCHEHTAAQQPGQDPRNTNKVALPTIAARLGPAATACTSLFAWHPQELQGRKKSAQIWKPRARAGADGREHRDTSLCWSDPHT